MERRENGRGLVARRAQHEREQCGDGGDLADPEEERPPEQLGAREGELFDDVDTQLADLLGQPPLESLGGNHQHVVSPGSNDASCPSSSRKEVGTVVGCMCIHPSIYPRGARLPDDDDAIVVETSSMKFL